MIDDILDPRLKRLGLEREGESHKENLDQLPTYEVFVQVKEPRPFKHEGCVHATSAAMALVFAKEQFSRRGICSGIWIISTGDIIVTRYNDNETDIYESFNDETVCSGEEYSLFHMIRRGTQHGFAGTVNAASPEAAISCAKLSIERKKPVLNVWVARTSAILKTSSADKPMWETTPKKLFREAIDYKTQEKLNKFKEGQS